MRFVWRQQEFTGWGELMCFVLVWAVGLAGLWFDYARRTDARPGDKVAVSGSRAPANANLD
jgi:hypothetical protein